MSGFKKIFSNEKVSASAGSGKTYSLTTRFIALACAKNDDDKFDPFSIIALTFTKKAAGEFLSNILKRLAKAAQSEEEAETLASSIAEVLPSLTGEHKPTRATFNQVLKQCAKNINKLHLSTIDSLFSAIIKQNANALKIFAPISISDENDFQAHLFALESVSRMMINQTLTPEETASFAELVKRASFGKEKKQLRESIITTLKIAHSAYLQNSDLSLWGNVKLSGVKFNNAKWNENLYAEKLSQLESAIGESKDFASILRFFRESGFARIETSYSIMMERIFQKKREGILSETTTLLVRSKETEFQCAKLVDEMLDMLFAEHFSRLCEASKAVGKIASLYENEYNQNVRQRGNITFSDMPFVLSDPERAMEKELIEYKLDAKFNHWLFDEFQDTSQIQWDVLRNLAEEAIVSPEKSFYYVGDIKQSIYSWRGATPKLFNEISDYYNTNVELISKSKPLTVSWRSGEHVIDAVNKIFGNADELKRVFPENAAETFSKEFAPHKSAETLGYKQTQPSFAQLSLYASSRKNYEDTQQACEKILEILKKTEPLKRGISCAVLVSKNSQANAIVDFLKENGYNAAGELSVPIQKDRPIVSIFTSILRRIAHPLNTASDAYCQMVGVKKFTENFSDNFIKKSLEKIYTTGYTSFAQDYENFMRSQNQISDAIEFKWLNDSCEKLDKTGITSIDDAVEFIARRKINTSAGDGVIQVMTVHKSKGLAFGMVIMPVKIENRPRNSIVKIGDAIALSPNEVLAEMNPILFEQSQKKRDSEAFETICKLYVAATRPERALYILAPQFSENSLKIKPEDNINFTQLMLQAIEPKFKTCATLKETKAFYQEFIDSGASLQIGDENWYENIAHQDEIASQITLPKINNIEPIKTVVAERPSIRTTQEETNDEATSIGIGVHKFFEKLTSLKNATEQLSNCSEISENNHLQKSISALLSNPDFEKFFDNPNAFEANEFSIFSRADDSFISGTIDRLIVFKENEKFTHAYILDYKASTDFVEKYKQQLYAYKKIVAQTFNLSETNISCFIAGYTDAKVKQL